jgi:hypothetical protein
MTEPAEPGSFYLGELMVIGHDHRGRWRRARGRAISAAAGDLTVALDSYDRRMQPVVAAAQAIAGQGAALLFPPTEQAIEERNATLQSRART